MTESNLPPRGHSPAGLRATILAIVLAWTFVYNLTIKELGVVGSFFGILDTISDDFVTGTFLTVGIGLAILAVFSLTKIYTQVVSNIYSFRIIEILVYDDLRRGQFRSFLAKILSLESQPQPDSCLPQRISSMLFSFSFIYIMSWVYVVLFSEALFFVSWSAGVNLEVNEYTVYSLPAIAMAIPLSARLMAYVNYPYAQDYADFMPGAVFVLLLVTASGLLFGSSTEQQSFLVQVYEQPALLYAFRQNGVLLAFIPLFFECGFWLFQLQKDNDNLPAEPDDPA